MTIIEGIGDEVIHFFLLLGTLLIALVAWWSTRISERPLMRTVLILERRTRQTPSDNQTALGDLRDSNELSMERSETEIEEKTSQSDNNVNNQLDVNVVEQIDNIFVNSEEIHNNMANLEETKTNSIINNDENLESHSKSEEISEKENNVSCSSTDSLNNVNKNLSDDSSTSNENDSSLQNEGNIRIKLKYLNDDQKLVEGKLQEQLGDFKRRHFSLELSGKKLVRLIFNGKVLQQDSKTLQNYGFFDNCVVHCLIHQARTPPPSPNLNRPRSDAGQAQNEPGHYHHWDLGNILFASLSFLLGLAWYGRYQYAQLYTATTTVALIGLTAMFTVSLIGMYMPDVDGLRTQ